MNEFAQIPLAHNTYWFIKKKQSKKQRAHLPPKNKQIVRKN